MKWHISHGDKEYKHSVISLLIKTTSFLPTSLQNPINTTKTTLFIRQWWDQEKVAWKIFVMFHSFSYAKIGKKKKKSVDPSLLCGCYTFYFSFRVLLDWREKLIKATETCMDCMKFTHGTPITPPGWGPRNSRCQSHVPASFISKQHCVLLKWFI